MSATQDTAHVAAAILIESTFMPVRPVCWRCRTELGSPGEEVSGICTDCSFDVCDVSRWEDEGGVAA
jgi:hypothetical protein